MMLGARPVGIHTAMRDPRPLSALSSWRAERRRHVGDRAIAATAEWVAG
jgi:hypothetical protein